MNWRSLSSEGNNLSHADLTDLISQHISARAQMLVSATWLTARHCRILPAPNFGKLTEVQGLCRATSSGTTGVE